MGYSEILLPFIGGLGMFIYGMHTMAKGLEDAAGAKVKNILEALTKKPILGVLFGAVVTALIQSSSATTVMVVGFVNAGVMNLYQAMSIIMGANIGTTVTGWIVSAGEWSKLLKPNTIAPLAIMLGVVFLLAGKRKILQELAGITIGFGLLFVGIGMMSDAVAPLKEFVGFREAFLKLGGNPLLGIVAGAVVTAVIQSSSASVGILQSLAAAGLVPFQTAVYIIMGQNIGTCITAMLSSIGTKENAKVAALIHLLFNVIGTTIFGIGAILYFTGAKPAWGTLPITQTQIGIVHTVFNVATTILLFPLSKRIIWLAKKMGNEKITPQ